MKQEHLQLLDNSNAEKYVFESLNWTSQGLISDNKRLEKVLDQDLTRIK